MTREEAIQIASEMGAHSYAHGWVVEALMKGCEIGKQEIKKEMLAWVVHQKQWLPLAALQAPYLYAEDLVAYIDSVDKKETRNETKQNTATHL